MIVLSADVGKTIPRQAMDRSVRLLLPTEEMFITGYDATNRAAMHQHPGGRLVTLKREAQSSIWLPALSRPANVDASA